MSSPRSTVWERGCCSTSSGHPTQRDLITILFSTFDLDLAHMKSPVGERECDRQRSRQTVISISDVNRLHHNNGGAASVRMVYNNDESISLSSYVTHHRHFDLLRLGTMADLAIPTSWPLPPTSPIPPTSPTQAVTSLQRQLKSLRIDIAELTAQAEAAADRTARVLQSLRSRDQVGSGTSNEPSSQETELSLTLRDHPFARFIYHDNALAHPSASASDAGQSAKTSRQGRSIALHRAETPIKGHASQVKASNTGFAPVAAPKVPLYSTYEQSRLFLQVTAAVKNEKNRSIQCDIVEVCPDSLQLTLQKVHYLQTDIRRRLYRRGLRNCWLRSPRRHLSTCAGWWPAR